MKIFRVEPDVERYKGLVDNEPVSISKERFDQLSFSNGQSKIDSWKNLSLRWIIGENTELINKDTYDQDHAIPDIAYWTPGCLILSPNATEIIKPSFIDEAEFLPVGVEGEKDWTILNVLNMQDVLDKANCRYHIHSDGTVGRRIKAIALFKDKITNSKLFRISGLTSYYYTSDSPGSFKKIVESKGLTGLKFTER